MKPLSEDTRPFSFLRLAHEAIRVALDEVIALAEADDDSLATELNELVEGIELHAEQEDHGLYPLMDESFDGVARGEGYRDEHVTLHEGNAHVQTVVAEGDREAKLTALRAWAQFNEEHLKHEEDVLQPCASKLTEDLPRACVQVQGIVDAVDRDKTETWQVGWVAKKLLAGRPFGKLAKYVQALQHISDEAQYARMKATLKAALPDDAWAQLEDKGLLADGRL
jgi:hemerythrin-like domain-containing protein